MGLYERSAQRLKQKLVKYGRAWTPERTSPDTSVQNFEVKALYVDTVKKVQEGTSIEIGDRRFLVESNGWAPKVHDKVPSEKGVVMHQEEIKPGEVLIGYWVWIRNG